MKITKALLTIVISISILLVYMACTTQNPLDQQYADLVSTIKHEKGFSSNDEVLNHYPELKEVEAQIQDIKQMYHDIELVSRHPSPTDKDLNPHFMSQIDEVKAMEKNVNLLMDQLRYGLDLSAKVSH